MIKTYPKHQRPSHPIRLAINPTSRSARIRASERSSARSGAPSPSAVFLIGYGTFRFLIEFVRVPDENRGYLAFDWLTMGQILSLPMIVAGLWMLAHAYRRNQPSGNHR